MNTLNQTPSVKKTILAQYFFVFVILFLFALNLWYKCTLALSYAPDLGGFERNVIWGIQQIGLGNPLYGQTNDGSFAFIQYMPLYYYLISVIRQILSVDPLDAHSIYVIARVFNLSICLISSFLVFLMARKPLGVSVRIALPIAVFSFLLMDQFAISGRPDSLKALFFQLLVFVLLRNPSRQIGYLSFFSILFPILAFFTKQDGLVFCSILPAVLLLQKDWKGFFLSSFIQLGIVLGGLYYIQSSTNGNFFMNVVGGLQNGISLSWFAGAFGNYFAIMAVLFSLALVLSVEFALGNSWNLNVLAASFIFSFFPQLVFSLKFGSGINYFTECTFISCLFLAVFLNKIQSIQFFENEFSRWLLPAVAIILFFLITSFHWITGVFINQESALKEKYENQKAVVKWMKDHSSNPSFKAMVLIQRQWEDHLTTLLADHVISPSRDVSSQVFMAKGGDDFKSLQKMVETGGIDYMVSEMPAVPTYLGFDYSGYSLKAEVSGYYIFSHVH